MQKYTTTDRLKQIMYERGLRQVDILDACNPYCKKYNVKLAKNDLSQYISGKVQPGQDKLSILGLALGVNEVWLMGYDVPPDRDALCTVPDENEQTHDEKTLLSLFKRASKDNQKLILDMVKIVVDSQGTRE